jgi:hypothetical protein
MMARNRSNSFSLGRMRPLVFATPLLLLVVSADARESRVLSVEQMIGRVLAVHAHQVSELAPPGHKEGDEPYLNHLMLLLKPSYQRLSYIERREFAFFVLAYTHPDAGYGISFMELIKLDAQRMAKDFAAIPEDTLRSKFCLSEKAIVDFRRSVEIMRTVDAKWVP